MLGTPIVLIVDDTPENRTLLSFQLQRLGYETTEAPSGEVALASAADARPDLILVDETMPGMSGQETIVALRRLLGPTVPPIISITADPSSDVIEACRNAGADRVLVKPILLEHIQSAAAELLPPAGISSALFSGLVMDAGTETATLVAGHFIANLEGRLTALASAIDSGESEEVRRAAHALRSASSALRATHVMNLCAKLETNPGMDAHIARELAAKIGVAAHEVRDDLQPYVPDSTQR